MEHEQASRGPARLGWLPALLVALPFLYLGIELLLTRPDITVFGDDALIDLGVLDLLGADQQLGVYSRFGFRHPGPALFVLAAPVVWITGSAPWSIFLAAQVLHMVSAVVLVEVVRRRAGWVAGMVAGTVVLLYTLVLGVGILRSPWNPLVVLLPMALLFVLLGTTPRFGPGSAGAVLLATFLVQANVGTALVVGVVMGVAVAWWTVRLVGDTRTAGLGPGRTFAAAFDRRSASWSALALGAAVTLWVPPIVEQLTNGGDGNMVRLVRSMRGGEATYGASPGLLDAAAMVGREAVVVPFGVPFGRSAQMMLTPESLQRTWGLLALGVVAALAVVLVVLGRRRHHDVVMQLGAVVLVGAAAAVVALDRVFAGVHWYLAVWATSLAVPLLIGLGVLGTVWARGRIATAMPAVVTVLAVALSAVAIGQAATEPDWEAMPHPGSPEDRKDWARPVVDAAWAAIADEVEDAEQVRIKGHDGIWWAIAAGLAVEMEQAGQHVTVDDEIVPLFGEQRRSTGDEDVTVVLATDGTKHIPPGTPVLTTLDGVPVYIAPD